MSTNTSVEHSSQYEQKGLSANLGASIEQAIAENKRWYIFQGVVFVLVGILAIALPAATAFGFNILIGSFLLVSGIVQVFSSIKSRDHWWSWVSGTLSVVVGLAMLFAPVAGILALATLLAVFLLAEGAIEILLAFRFKPLANWGWLLFSGIVSLFLGILLFIGWPGITVLFLGIIVGINLLFYGASVLALAASVNGGSRF